MTGAVFELLSATVVIDTTIVLNQVDFRLDRGEFLALIGDNGSGKTTLVRTLLGLLPLTHGTLDVFSVPASRFRERDRIGYVPQRFAASTGVPATVLEVVISGRAAKVGVLRRYGVKDRRLAERSLEAVGLAERLSDPVASLSSGQQQRVLIARALAAEPEVLILDEPASALDQESQDALAATLGLVREEGRSVLLVAHGLGPIEPLVTRVVALGGGQVVFDGPPLVERLDRPHLHVMEAGGRHPLHAHHHPPAED
jgi:zinc transport system ATP-binding protein